MNNKITDFSPKNNAKHKNANRECRKNKRANQKKSNDNSHHNNDDKNKIE